MRQVWQDYIENKTQKLVKKSQMRKLHKGFPQVGARSWHGGVALSSPGHTAVALVPISEEKKSDLGNLTTLSLPPSLGQLLTRMKKHFEEKFHISTRK